MTTKTDSIPTNAEVMADLMQRYDSTFPLTWHTTVLLCRAAGYWCSPHILGEMIDRKVILCPVGNSVNTMEFYETDVLAVMDELNRRRLWLANSPLHHRKRNTEEMLEVLEKRDKVVAYIHIAQTKPMHEVIEFLLDEPDKDLQRLILVYLKDRLVDLEVGQ